MSSPIGTWLDDILVPGAAVFGGMGNIRAASDGIILFTEGNGSLVKGNFGTLNPSTRVVTEVAAPVASTMGGICDLGNGRVAYSLSSAHTLVICNRDGTQPQTVDVGPAAGAGEPILGPDGYIWVAGANNGVRMVDPVGYTAGTYVASVYTVGGTYTVGGGAGSVPHSMTVGSDGRLYVSCITGDQIAALAATVATGALGTITNYQSASKYQHVGSLQGSRYNSVDGKIYFTRGPGRCTLGRMSLLGVFDPEWALQTPFATPTGIAIDAAGNLWVGCRGANRIECYSTAGKRLATVTCPTPGSNPNKLTYANGYIYAAEWNAGTIGVIQAV